MKDNLSSNYLIYPSLYSIRAREIGKDDAEYIYNLRIDDKYNKYLSQVPNGVEAQRNYIKNYLQENKVKRSSFYFIFENMNTNLRCGTVRVYNFKDDKFEWGSWILDSNKSHYAALETAILVYEFSFNSLGFKKSEFEVNKNNTAVINYHKRCGAKIIGEDKTNLYFLMTKKIGLECALNFRDLLESKQT